MRKPIKVTVVTAALIGVLVLGAALASAASVGTRVTIHFDKASPARDVFRGQVFSPRHACEENRRVVVFRKHMGPDARIGSDRSEDNGHWSVDVEGHAAPGHYYAKALRKDLGADFCEVDRSHTITVG